MICSASHGPRSARLPGEGAIPVRLTMGYSEPLYILPFDHRASFESGMFGWTGPLNAEQTARIAAAKRVIYDGFVAAVASGVPKDRAGILVDERFGEDILRDAKRDGTSPVCPQRRVGKTSSTSSLARSSRGTSKSSHPRSARCSCATTRKAMRS